MSIPSDTKDERRGADPGQLSTDHMQQTSGTPRTFTEIWDTERGPAEVQVTERVWDIGNGPEVAQWRRAPGWVFGLKGEKIGEVSPAPETSLDVSYHYWSGERAGKVDVMVFGPADEDEGGPAPETLYEKLDMSFSVQDARLFAQQLLDAASHAEEAPGGKPEVMDTASA